MNFTRMHMVYDVNKNPTVIYRTDEANDDDGGLCQVEKREYNVEFDMTNSFLFMANVWQSAWNIDKSL